jgi:hypothetical protein
MDKEWSTPDSGSQCFSYRMVETPTDKKKWNLCNSQVDYAHSSAMYYTTGKQGFYEVTGYALLMDIDLTVEKEKM